MEKVNIFLSYCWSDMIESKRIYDYFKNIYEIELHMDVIDIKGWGSIKEYMESLSNMDYTILLISEKYLKSANCMYEVLEVMKDKNYRDKIFPAVIYPEIYNPITRANYVKHWQDEFKELESILKEIDVQNLGNLNEELRRRQNISANIAEFLYVISDMNNPALDDVCEEIEKKLKDKGLLKSYRNSSFELIVDKTTKRFIVVGVGDAGNIIINRIVDENIPHIEFVGINTDKQALQACQAPVLLQIGKRLTNDLGTNAEPSIGKLAANESSKEIKAVLENAEIVFVICGMGGGTGTGAAPVVARLSKEMGILTIGIVTKPFCYEGDKYIENSNNGIIEMKRNADSLIIISNDDFQEFMERNFILPNVFTIVDLVFLQIIKAIYDLIDWDWPSLFDIELNVEDLRAIMKDSSIAYLGIGRGIGKNKAYMAAKMATEMPFIDANISEASDIIVHFCGKVTQFDIDSAIEYIKTLVNEFANIIPSVCFDDFETNILTVTIIAAGIDPFYFSHLYKEEI